MQLKTAILTGLFFLRHQGGSDAAEDFFTFAKKYIEKQNSHFVYECELNSNLIYNTQTLLKALEVNPSLVQDAVQKLLDSSEKIAPAALFSCEAKGFKDDLQYMTLRRILLKYVEQADGLARDLTIKLLLRWGLIRASAEDLLHAAQLSKRYNVDISSDLEFFCKSSEVFKKPAPSANASYERNDAGTVQSHVYHQNNSDRCSECDQFVTDGTHWFMYSDTRGFTKATKR